PLLSLLDANYSRVVCGVGWSYRLTTKDASVVRTGRSAVPAGVSVVSRSIAGNDRETVAAFDGAGLWETKDLGQTWTRITTGDFSYVGLTNDSSGGALFEQPGDTFWITYDGGGTWEPHAFR